MAQSRKAVLFALAAVCLWSTVASGFKLGLAAMTTIQLLWLGTLVSTAFFLLLHGWRVHRGIAHRPVAGDWAAAALFGALNPTLYYLILFEAYDRLPAQIAQPLNYTWAITLALLAVPILKQRLTGRRIAGMAVSYAGVVILLTQGNQSLHDGLDVTGVVLALLSTVVWAGYWLMNARTKSDPILMLTMSFGLALPVLTALCLYWSGLPELTLTNLAFGGWVGLIEMGITFVLWQQALRRTHNAATIGQLIFLSPFLSLVLIDTLVGETIAAASWAGLAVIVAGLLVSGDPGRSDSGLPAGAHERAHE